MTNDEVLFFEGEDGDGDNLVAGGSETRTVIPWKVMIVDDEPAVHDVTRLALSGVTFAGQPLEFISCYSGAEAMEAIQAHPETALMLLDVVMESDHAGLDVARKVREDLGNSLVRIVLRTGQPGQAPERRVITDYDINDYKEKTELTASKLFTLLFASLRAYQSIVSVERSKRGLAKVIEASADIFKLSSMDRFAHGVLEQLSALLQIGPGALLMQERPVKQLNGFAASYAANHWQPIAGVGKFADPGGQDLEHLLGEKRLRLIDRALEHGKIIRDEFDYIACFEDRLGHRNLLFIEGGEPLDDLELDLVELFVRNVSIAFENVHLHNDLNETQRDMIFLLGEAVEARSQETGNHVRRVAEISRILAEQIGLDEDEASLIKQASPLHDLGKIAIPDVVLNKAGTLSDEEMAIMKKHAEIGYAMLSSSPRRTMQAAAMIARDHHERWDGKGYPNGRKGEEIDLYGRITAVADVFDALLSERCYKPAWTTGQVLSLFRDERGRQFDPQLVDALFARLDDIQAVRDALPDHQSAFSVGQAGTATV